MYYCFHKSTPLYPVVSHLDAIHDIPVFPLMSLLLLYFHLLMNIRVFSLNVFPITTSYACVFPTLCIYWFRMIFTVNDIRLLGFVMTLCVYCEVLNECLYIFRLPRGIKEIKNLHKPNTPPMNHFTSKAYVEWRWSSTLTLIQAQRGVQWSALRGSKSCVPRSRNCSSCVPRWPLQVYQLRPGFSTPSIRVACRG